MSLTLFLQDMWLNLEAPEESESSDLLVVDYSFVRYSYQTTIQWRIQPC